MPSNEVAGVPVKDGVTLNHLFEDVLKLVVGGKGRRCRCFLKEGFHEFSSDVLFLFGQLWFKTEPQNGPATVVVGRRFVNVDKDGFTGDVDEVERTLLFRIPVQRPVVDGPRTVPHLEITNPLGHVRVGRHDAVQVALCKSRFVHHDVALLSSPP